MIVAIEGPKGSVKSTLLHALRQTLPAMIADGEEASANFFSHRRPDGTTFDCPSSRAADFMAQRLRAARMHAKGRPVGHRPILVCDRWYHSNEALSRHLLKSSPNDGEAVRLLVRAEIACHAALGTTLGLLVVLDRSDEELDHVERSRGTEYPPEEAEARAYYRMLASGGVAHRVDMSSGRGPRETAVRLSAVICERAGVRHLAGGAL